MSAVTSQEAGEDNGSGGFHLHDLELAFDSRLRMNSFRLASLSQNMLLLMEYVFLRNRILQLPASVLLAFDLRTGLLVSLPFCDCSGRLY